MNAAYGERPLIGYTVTLDELRTDYEVYKLLYTAISNGSGGVMTEQQTARLKEMIDIFEPQGV